MPSWRGYGALLRPAVDLDGAGAGGALDGAEFLDGFHEGFGGLGRVVFGGEDGEGETEGGAGAVVGVAHGFLDVAGLLLAGHAGAAGGALDAVLVEEDEEAGGLAAVEGEVGDVEGAAGGVAVAEDAADALHDLGLEGVAEGGGFPVGAGGVLAAHDFGGGSEGDDGGDVLGAGAAAAFLAAAAEEGVEAEALAEVEGADALGGVELVAAEGEEVNGDFPDVDGHFADGLDGVGVDGEAVFLGEGGGLGEGLGDAGLVVHPHEGEEKAVVPGGGGERFPQGGEVEEAAFGDGEAGDAEAGFLHGGERAEDGAVLDPAGEDVAVLAAEVAGEGLEGGVVGFGAAAGEDDFGGVGVDEGGDLGPRPVDGLARFFGGAVAAGGVVEAVAEPGEHGVEDFGVDGGGGVVVEVGHAGFYILYFIFQIGISKCAGMSTGEHGEGPRWQAVAGVAVCALLWGSAFPGIKTAYAAWESGGLGKTVWRLWWFAGLRMALAGAALFFLAKDPAGDLRRVFSGGWARIRWLALLVLCQTFFQYVLFYPALDQGSGTLTALLTSTGSFWWLLLAPLFGRARWGGWKAWAVLALGAAGVSMAVYAPGPAARNPGLATALMLASNLSGAVAVLAFGRVREWMGAQAATGCSLFGGGVMLALLGSPASGTTGEMLGGGVLWITLWLAFVSAAAVSLWNELTTRYPVALLATFRFLIPVCGVLEAALFLEGERVGAGVLAGGTLVLVAMTLAQRLTRGKA